MKFGEIRSTNNMKHIGKIIVIAFVALGASGGLWYYLNTYLSQSNAAGEIAHVRFSSTSIYAKEGDEIRVDVVLSTSSTTNTYSGISGIDLAFVTTGSNLEFLYARSTTSIPVGFDEYLLNESAMTSGTTPKQLKRVMIVAKRPAAQLQKSIIIPLYFKVFAGGTSATNLSINAAVSQVVGPPSLTYPVTLVADASSFTVTINNILPAASASNLFCDDARNMSRSNCGKGIALTWTDSPADDGYKIYRNRQLIKTLGKDAASYNDLWCANFNPVTYSVIAYNAGGSASTTEPTISCSCQICPTAAPPSPSPVPPSSSANLIFHAIFPNAAATVQQIPDVKIIILDNNGKRICNDDTDCARTVTFRRIPDTRVPNTFSSPQLSYNLKNNQAYSVIIKQNHTVRQTYKDVYLKWQKVLQCYEGTLDSGCGKLIEEVVVRPLYSGDVDKSNSIDMVDQQMINEALGTQSAEGDLNFDGVTNQKDIDILGRNFNKKGT